MRVHIFNVGHGSCAYLIADNSHVMLFDCGHDDEVGFRPSTYLPARGCTGIERLIISHYDEDHVSDLANLRQMLPIQTVYRNKTVPVDWVRGLKAQGGQLGPGLHAALDLASRYNAPVDFVDFAGVEFVTFRNEYPAFQDTNNLSLVSFVHHPNLSLVFPGDLERAGWQGLLRIEAFREQLARVRVFVASHHGRTNGYLPEVFNCCRPDIVVISDTAMQHDTQEHCYAQHAKGVRWDDGRTRYVLTTRRDGHISIETNSLGYRMLTSRQLP